MREACKKLEAAGVAMSEGWVTSIAVTNELSTERSGQNALAVVGVAGCAKLDSFQPFADATDMHRNAQGKRSEERHLLHAGRRRLPHTRGRGDG